VSVHLESSDPTRVLLAPNATTAGAAFIDIPLANGQVSFSYIIQGTDWVAGSSSSATVTITASAPGFTNRTATATYVQPAVALSSLPATTTAAAANVDFYVQVGVASSGNGTVQTAQARRAGAPDLTVTVTNSNATAAEIDLNGGINGAQLQTAAIKAGSSNTPNNATGGLEFDPLTAGTTAVAAGIPNFITTSAGAKSVTITP
jgi:hypothetical protein